MTYAFQYVPASGDLSGKAFEEQTERAINEIGDFAEQGRESAREAVDIANSAVAAASDAVRTTQQANQTAQEAKDAAERAGGEASAAMETAGTARQKADLAHAMAETAGSAAGAAAVTANGARQAAAEALSTAGEVRTIAELARESASGACATAGLAVTMAEQGMGLYVTRADAVDADAEFHTASRLYLTNSASRNLPVPTPVYLDVEKDDGETSVIQTVRAGDADNHVFAYSRIGAVTQPLNSGVDAYVLAENGTPVSALTVHAEDGALTVAAASGAVFTHESGAPGIMTGILAVTLSDPDGAIVSIGGTDVAVITNGVAAFVSDVVIAGQSQIVVDAARSSLSGNLLSLAITADWMDREAAVVAWGEWREPGGNSAGLPLLSMIWSTLGTAESGYLDASRDNGLLSRAAFPGAWDKIQTALKAGSTTVVDDAVWTAERDANGGTCGRYSTGDGETTFRIPLLRRVYVRAADAGGGLAPGVWQGDQLETHAHLISAKLGADNVAISTNAPNANPTMNGTAAGLSGTNSAPAVLADKLYTGTSGSETRPVTIVYTPLIKMYGAVADAGEADIAGLVEAVAGKLDTAAYEADVLTKAKGWARVRASGEILESCNISSVQNISTGVYHITSPAIRETACILIGTWSNSSNGTGYLYGTIDAGRGITNGSCHVTLINGNTLVRGGFVIVIFGE